LRAPGFSPNWAYKVTLLLDPKNIFPYKDFFVAKEKALSFTEQIYMIFRDTVIGV